VTNKKITWSKTSLSQFDAAIEYIKAKSVTDAENIRLQILQKVGQLALSPEMHPPDKYKMNNDGTYRAFELFHYRISYRIIKNEIEIFRVRHTNMMPKLH
jgi:plasmid stabilization system protein ParE